jgi:perosamine synthetase
MVPRNKLDIGFADLLAATFSCFWPAGRGAAREALERDWRGPREERSLACLSVRTGFDLVLSAMKLPRGSEVIFSAVTIRDMVRITRQHDLVPVPVDVDMNTLSVDPDALARAITPRTRLVVLAHLFGSRMPLDEIVRICQDRGVPLLEDCAQAFVGHSYHGHPGAAVHLFSFGPIKTNTALGGALLTFGDGDLDAAVRALESRLPPQPRIEFLGRILKYLVIKLLLLRPLFTAFVWSCRRVGVSHDAVISDAVRGFGGTGFFERIRRRPSYPLLALLHRRLRRFDAARIGLRVAAAEAAIRALGPIPRPGAAASRHSHWVFPVRTQDPQRLAERLWAAGLDATRGASSLHVVELPPGRRADAPERAVAGMREILYLPVHAAVQPRDLRRLAAETRVAIAGGRHADAAAR